MRNLKNTELLAISGGDKFSYGELAGAIAGGAVTGGLAGAAVGGLA